MQRSDRNRRAFTLAELLVVIGIIAVLIAILIPAISRVRDNAHKADTANFISQLQASIENYYQIYKAYPGPVPDDAIRNLNFTPGGTTWLGIDYATGVPANFDGSWNSLKITGSENLALGLLGGLKYDVVNATPTPIRYDPTQVGLGPMTLSRANPKRDAALADTAGLSWRERQVGGATLKSGRFADDAGFADDTIIPEFVDRFPKPMPILYMRSKKGVKTISTGTTAVNNSVITLGNDPPAVPRLGAYDVAQIIAYTGAYNGDETAPALDTSAPSNIGGRSIGEGKRAPAYYDSPTQRVSLPNSNWFHGLRQDVEVNAKMTPQEAQAAAGGRYFYPLNAFPYFQDPTMPNSGRQKDGYILISAGVDRIYGTNDDIVSFGSVQK